MSPLKPRPREPRALTHRRATPPTVPELATQPRARPATTAAVILATILPLAVAGCGNSQQTPPPKRPSTTRPTPTPTTERRSVSAGALHLTLGADNHSPTINQPWPYTVKVTNTTAHPMSGTVAIEFLFAGQIVAYDKPPSHPIANGLWQSTLKFPPTAAGYPLTLRAIAHTPEGSITIDWPVTVHRKGRTRPARQ